MPAGIDVILLIIALICFLVAAIGIAGTRVNLVALGLFFWVLSLLAGGGRLSP